MILKGADLEDRTSAGRTPLYIAAKHGSLEVLKTLQAAGADVDAKSQMYQGAMRNLLVVK